MSIEESPTVFGPGIWMLAHTITANCNLEKEYKNIISFTHITINNIPCSKCRNDSIKYLKENPLNLDIKDNESAFKWWWRFHNYVNTKLSKNIMQYDTALKRYRYSLNVNNSNNSGICVGCESAKHEKTSNLLDLLKSLNDKGTI